MEHRTISSAALTSAGAMTLQVASPVSEFQETAPWATRSAETSSASTSPEPRGFQITLITSTWVSKSTTGRKTTPSAAVYPEPQTLSPDFGTPGWNFTAKEPPEIW